jgi:hypothetical protein
MKIVEALRTLKRIREARDELFRGFNDGHFFNKAEKESIDDALAAEREKVIAEIKLLAEQAKPKVKK